MGFKTADFSLWKELFLEFALLVYLDFQEEIKDFQNVIQYRSMLVKKTKVIPIECIVRGYISGSAWKSYKKNQSVCGMQLPSGLRESEMFDEPMFTPSTKAETGHDINISFEKMVELIGRDTAEKIDSANITYDQNGWSEECYRGKTFLLTLRI